MPDTDDPACVERLRASWTPSIGGVAGAAVWLAGCRPTGTAWFDLMLLATLMAVVIGSVDGVPDSLVAIVATGAMLAAGSGVALAVGAAVVAGSLALWWMRRDGRSVSSTERAFAAASAFVVLSTAGDRWRFGLTSLFGVAAGITMLVVAAQRTGNGRALRRWTIGVITAAAIATAGFMAAGLAAGDSVRQGDHDARAGITALRSGDIESARALFAGASVAMRHANIDLRRPWGRLAQFVPLVGQHYRAATGISEASEHATGTMAEQLATVDLGTISITDGRIDIDAIAELGPPLAAAQAAANDLAAVIDDTDSEWLVRPLRRRLAELGADVDRQVGAGSTALDAIALAPALLGADAPRTYFVMFTTPAEARGQGGFMASYAEIRIDAGRMSVGTVGRTIDLNRAGVRPRFVTGPDDWLGRYGQYGFTTGPGGSTSEEPWSNITISPDFPATAEVVSELYPQSGGRQIDGVVSLDVFALERIVDAVGPIDVPGVATTLDGTDTASFLLFDQYQIEQTERIDLLALIAQATIDRLLSGAAEPLDLGRTLAPMVRQHRTMVWSQHPAEQSVFERSDLAGRLLAGVAPGEAGFSLRVVNSSASKIDSFLERFVCIALDTGAGRVRSANVRLTNHAPSSGYPDYVIGNTVGLPVGWSRLIASWHSTVAVSSIKVDGVAIGLSSQREAGAWAYSAVVTIAPGATSTIEITFEDDRVDARRGIFVEPQPLVLPEHWTVASAGDSCTASYDPSTVVETSTWLTAG